MLSKDRLTNFESNVLYVEPKIPLSRARDNDYSLKLGMSLCNIGDLSMDS
jgi:hypothetical protein